MQSRFNIVTVAALVGITCLLDACASKTVTLSESRSSGYYTSYEGTDAQFGVTSGRDVTVERADLNGPRPAERITLYLIALADHNQNISDTIGCGDQLSPVEIWISAKKPLVKTAFAMLLTLTDPSAATANQTPLYNPFQNSTLKIKQATLTTDTAILALTGKAHPGGVCDIPRMKAMLEKTAQQFPGIIHVEITLNGKPFDQALSGSGL